MKEDRRYSVPNPIAHLLLSRVLADNYVNLRSKARASKITLSPPTIDWIGARALMRSTVQLRDDFRVNLSSRREEYVVADIRAFFHSIYTHAIAWAIHGKAFAKQNRSPTTHYGNLIDLICRNAQGGQTIGLPVGPDTSRLIAEVLASAIDVELQNQLKVGKRDASRYVDDYTLSSPDGALGEELLSGVREVAAAFELELNNEKSGIFPTSRRQDIGWQQAARAHIPKIASAQGGVVTSELRHFFYELGRVCDAHPEVNVEKFGLQHARTALVAAADWKEIQFDLINAYRRNPTLIPFLVEICLLRQVAHQDVDATVIRELIEHRIPFLAKSNRTGEIVWLLFLSIRLNISLSGHAVRPLSRIENSFVALLVVCLNARGLLNGSVDRSIWDQSLNADGLRGPMWLYAYEAVTQGFLPGTGSTFIDNDPYFSLLKAKRVQFLDVTRGFESISTILSLRRSENERNRLLRTMIGSEDFDELDDYDFEDEELFEDGITDIY